MLKNRILKLILTCLIVAINYTEQRQRNQVPPLDHRISQPPQIQLLDLQQKLLRERELKARELLKYMNLNGEACKDFYDYACGKWLQKQDSYGIRDGDLVSVQTIMEKEVNKELQAALIEPISSLDSMDTRVAKDYYIPCLSESAYSPVQKQFIRSFILSYGSLPDVKSVPWPGNYNWINIIADLRRKYGMDILIGLTIDHTNPNYKDIYIEEPKTTLLPVELCSSLATRQLNENDKIIVRIQNEIKNNLLKWLELTEVNALRKARAILHFEFDLCKYMRVDQMAATPADNNSNGSTYSLHIEENKFDDMVSLQKLNHLSDYYLINFKDFVQRSLATVTVSQVYFRSVEYFKQLGSLAQKGIEATFANYIMYRALSEINFPLNERPEERPFYCANQVMRYMPQVLGKLYNDKYYLEERKHDVREMFFTIKQAVANHLQRKIHGFSDNIMNLINNKFKNLNVTFSSYPQNSDILKGLPLHDILRGLPLKDDQNYWQKLQTIMMYKANQTLQQYGLTLGHSNYLNVPPVSIQIKPTTMELVVGYGVLQKPFYSPLYSKAFKYSSIGVAIAKEIIKMLLQDPLNASSECFRKQMSNYFYNKPNIYRNATKLREIMLETSAINIAFNAYLNWLDVNGRSDSELRMETLPNINFTNTQLFFINFAQSRCAARYNVKFVPKSLPLFRRTLEEYDINGPLTNSIEFSRDFSCQLGFPMNLDDKCLLY